MEKIITTESGKEIKLNSSAAFLYIYKNQFREDPLKDLMGMSNAFTNKSELNEMMAGLDLEILYNMSWALAKCGDPTIPEPIEFYKINDDFLPLDHAEEIVDLALSSLTTTVKINTKN